MLMKATRTGGFQVFASKLRNIIRADTTPSMSNSFWRQSMTVRNMATKNRFATLKITTSKNDSRVNKPTMSIKSDSFKMG